MAVSQMMTRVILFVLIVNGALSKKRDVSWFGKPRTEKMHSPNLEQVHIQHPQYQDTQSLQEASKKLKTITDVIDETLSNKQQDTIAKEAEKAGLKYKQMGCYYDNAQHEALPEQLVDLQRSIDWADLSKTVKVCAMEAKKAGYQVFGIQKFGICFSGKDGLHTYDKFGKSEDCTMGVGRFGSNFVYTFETPVVPMKRPTVHCFPGESQVETNDGKLTMSTVTIGDRIKTLDREGHHPIYSEVVAFLHRQHASSADYLSISTSNGRTLRVSNKHLVFKVDTITNKTIEAFASDLKVGDTLLTVGQSSETSRIVKITMATREGIYAPLTRHGTMLVDGVLVSCYAHWDSHTVAHITMMPLRIWTDVTSTVTSIGRLLGFHGNHNHLSNIQEGIHWYALSLMSIVEKFVPLN